MADARKRYRMAEAEPGAWKLPYIPGEVWNIPTKEECPSGEVRFDIGTRGPWGIVTKITGLAVDLDGTIYGMRTMSWPRESGHELEGWVSVHGRKRSAFTSSTLFEREDGSLVDVGVLVVRRKVLTGVGQEGGDSGSDES